MEFAPALFGALIGGLIILILLRQYDRVEPEPVGALLLVGGIGGVISSVPAFILNTSVKPMVEPMVYEFFVGFNEEICKAVTAMLVIKRLGDLDEPIDALIYSMTVALGFAILENVLYAMHYGPGTLIIRHFMSVPIHMSLAALWGIGVMHYYFNNPDNRSAFRILTPYVLSASLTHTLYNYFAETDVINAAFFVFVLVKLADSSLTRLLRESPFLKEGECPYCGRFNVFFTKKCAQCGEVIESDLLTKCSGCDTRILKQSKVCPECGLEH